MKNLGDTWSSIKDDKIILWVSIAIAIVLVAALLISGMGIFSVLLLIVLIIVVIFFGSITQLAQSIVLGVLLKMYITEIKTILGFWTTSEGVKKTLDYVANTGTINVVIVLFIFIFGVSALSGSIKLFNVRQTNSNSGIDQSS